jgi:hypothetical protein
MISAFDAVQMQRRNGFMIRSDIGEALQARARKARRFYFDAEASTRVGEILRDIPDLLVRENAFARAPFDQCWVEVDNHRYWEALIGRDVAADADERVAFFIDHDKVYSAAYGEQPGKRNTGAQFGLVEYALHTPWPLADQLAFTEVLKLSRIGLDAFLWGQTYDRLSTDERRLLRGTHACRLLPLIRDVDLAGMRGVEEIGIEAAGELKMLIGLLLVLNRPSLTTYREVGRSKGFYRGKLRQYLEHTVVSINVDPVPTLRKIGTPGDAGTPKRRHEVRGHWCHDAAYRAGQAKGCLHAWEPEAASDTRFTCQGCGGFRWWRIAHMRGSALEGFVAHDGYELRA